MHTQTISPPLSPAPVMERGFRLAYNEANAAPMPCPGCGHSNWRIGRVTAECAFCDTALPLEHIHSHGFAPRFITSGAYDEQAYGLEAAGSFSSN
ncbi:MAG: hypothetical protein R3E11_03230 [Sphingobium sp.]|nr:hypothetical protein [Sphingobium sp.]MCP5398506.1 hypothetical protein [Sphingomonas sp.]